MGEIDTAELVRVDRDELAQRVEKLEEENTRMAKVVEAARKANSVEAQGSECATLGWMNFMQNQLTQALAELDKWREEETG